MTSEEQKHYLKFKGSNSNKVDQVKFLPQFKTAYQLLQEEQECQGRKDRADENERRVVGAAAY